MAEKTFDQSLSDHLQPIGMGARPSPPLDSRAVGDLELAIPLNAEFEREAFRRPPPLDIVDDQFDVVVDGTPLQSAAIALYNDLLFLREQGMVMFVGGPRPSVHPTTEATRGDDAES